MDAKTYSIGLCYMLCENSRYWNSSTFEKIQKYILQYKNQDKKLLLMGYFIARTGNLIDYIVINDEDEQVPPRFNKDSRIITNGKLLIDWCKNIESVLVNGRLKDRNSVNYSCITHNGESAKDYFIVDYHGFNDVSEKSVHEFDPSSSGVHCPVAMELKNQKHVPVKIYERNQKLRRWNRLMQVWFYEEINKKEMTALEKLVKTVKTPIMLKENMSTMKEFICDSARRVGALSESQGKPTFTSNNRWFDTECQSKRSIFRKRLRWPNKWNDKNERKTAFRDYKDLLIRKRKFWMVDTNSNLRRKQSENPKSFWSFFRKLDRKDERISIEITKMYNHFKSLSSTNVCSQICYSDKKNKS